MKTEMLKISELIMDKAWYPRYDTDWLTVSKYAEAMEMGAIFPNITVAKIGGKWHVVDGWHRIGAYKQNQQEFVQADIDEKIKTMEEIFVESVRINNAHGRPITMAEKVDIRAKLEGMKMSIKDISKLLQMPLQSSKWEGVPAKPAIIRNDYKPRIAKAEEPEIKHDEKKEEIAEVSVAQKKFCHNCGREVYCDECQGVKL